MLPLLIFTDLDGTLLDHEDYGFEPARPLLRELDRHDVPWILNTSKTLAELLPLRQRLGHRFPFIVENGAAVFIPKSLCSEFGSIEATGQQGRLRLQSLAQAGVRDSGDYWCMAFGPPRAELLQALQELTQEGDAQGFASMSVEQIQQHTGLDANDAQLAQQRDYTEPMLWLGSEQAREQFAAALAVRDLQLVQGGRFLHLMGRFDKGLAMQWLTQQYQRSWGQTPITIALGDSDNDRPMLERADYPVVVRSPVRPPLTISTAQPLYLTQGLGPSGWAEAITLIWSSLISESEQPLRQ